MALEAILPLERKQPPRGNLWSAELQPRHPSAHSLFHGLVLLISKQWEEKACEIGVLSKTGPCWPRTNAFLGSGDRGLGMCVLTVST